MLDINNALRIPDSEFRLTYVRSSGPGGQNVNKVNSRAVLAWDVANSPSLPDDIRERFLNAFRRRISREGMLQISSQRYRDQARNADDCRAKLAEMILSVARPPVKRRQTKPSQGARQRRLEQKHQRSERKQSRRRPPSGD